MDHAQRTPSEMHLSNDEVIECEDRHDCRWGAIAHLSAMLPLPLFDLLGPFIVLLTKGDQSFFIRRQAIQALNFRLTVLIAYILCIPFFLILIGFVMWWIVWLASIVFCIIAAIKASEGRTYRFPLTLQLFQ